MRRKNGWRIVGVAPEVVEGARPIRAERDQRYGNIFEEKETDFRWADDLGDIYFDQWLRYERIETYQWITDAPTGRAQGNNGGRAWIEAERAIRLCKPTTGGNP